MNQSDSAAHHGRKLPDELQTLGNLNRYDSNYYLSCHPVHHRFLKFDQQLICP